MAKPRRRTDGRWELVVSLGFKAGARQRRTFYGETAREAKQAHNDAVAREGGRLRTYGGNDTVGDLMDTWLAVKVDRSLAPTTIATYRGMWTKHGEPYIASKRFESFDSRDVDGLYETLQKAKVGAATIAKTRNVIRKAFEDARKGRLGTKLTYRGENPFALAEAPKYGAKERTSLTLPEAKRVIKGAEASKDRYEAAIVLALACGMRLGEIMGLRWGDIDWKAKHLYIRRSLQEVGGHFSFSEGKTGTARRRITLGSLALAALKRRLHIAELTEPNELVFTTTAGTPVGRTVFRDRHFKEILKTAKVPAVRFHDLRHSFASLLLEQREPVKVVAEALGHANPAITTRLYQHVLGDLQGKAMASIDKALR